MRTLLEVERRDSRFDFIYSFPVLRHFFVHICAHVRSNIKDVADALVLANNSMRGESRRPVTAGAGCSVQGSDRELPQLLASIE